MRANEKNIAAILIAAIMVPMLMLIPTRRASAADPTLAELINAAREGAANMQSEIQNTWMYSIGWHQDALRELEAIPDKTASELAEIRQIKADILDLQKDLAKAMEAQDKFSQARGLFVRARNMLEAAARMTGPARDAMIREANKLIDHGKRLLDAARGIQTALAALIASVMARVAAMRIAVAAMVRAAAARLAAIGARVIPPVAAVATGMSIGTFNLWGRYMGKIQAINMACVQLQNCRNMVRVAVQMGMPAPVCNPTDLEIQNNITALSRDAAAIAAVYNAIPLLDDIAPPIPRCAA